MRRYCGPTLNGPEISCPLSSFLPWVALHAISSMTWQKQIDPPTGSPHHWRRRRPPPPPPLICRRFMGLPALFGDSDSVLLGESLRRIRQNANRNSIRSQGAAYVMHVLTLIAYCRLLHRLRPGPFHDVSEEPSYTSWTICWTNTRQAVSGCYFISPKGPDAYGPIWGAWGQFQRNLSPIYNQTK